MGERELLSELVRGRMGELGLTDTDLAERMHWLAHAAGQAGEPVPPCGGWGPGYPGRSSRG